MDSILLKIICAVLMIILFISCTRPWKSSIVNKEYSPAPYIPVPEIQEEILIRPDDGTRAEMRLSMDNSAAPGMCNDTNPE
ncbi:MAG: hypothetical protein M3R17_09740 [Bacteroidota bacterium]|nr:hypothetical protein [Bacteroidota bacterium]